MPFAIIMTEERPPDVSARKFSDFSKGAMGEPALLWEDKYLDFHFEPFSGPKYGYAKRRPATLAKKRGLAKLGVVKKGGRALLVHTGLLQEQMKRPGRLRVFPSRFVLTKPASSYVTDRPQGRRPNMVREITTVLSSEEVRMAERYRDVLTERLNTYRATRRKTIRS